MSLPELAFVNLRKGTNDWVPESAWQELGVDAQRLAAPAPGVAAVEPPAALR
jgi:hypothetical protein